MRSNGRASPRPAVRPRSRLVPLTITQPAPESRVSWSSRLIQVTTSTLLQTSGTGTTLHDDASRLALTNGRRAPTSRRRNLSGMV